MNEQNIPLKTSYWPKNTALDMLHTTLGSLLRQVAGQVPSRVALVEGSVGTKRRRWTYAELLAKSENVAQALLQLFEPGERVAIYSPNSPEWIFLQHGASLGGLVLVPLNPAYTLNEVQYALQESGAAGIFFVDMFRGVDLRAVVSQAKENLPHLRHAISLSDWARFSEAGASAKPFPTVAPDNMLQLQFTSGTTGFPKGACLTHLGVVNASRFSTLATEFPDGGVWISAMPMFHVGGVNSAVGTLACRGTFVLMQGFDAALMLELFEAERGIATLVVPTMLWQLLDHPDIKTRDLSSIRTMACGASAISPALVERTKQILGCNFSLPFGQSELSGSFAQVIPTDETQLHCETVGRPFPHVEVKIADPVTGDILPIGALGEICVRGYQTMSGFFRRPEETQKTLGADGWLRMGDMGSMDERGYLRLTGRLKDMIIRGGMNIYPMEIENLLAEHPAVARASIIGVPDEKWGEIVAAVIMPDGVATPPTAEDLHNHCRARLASFKTPVLWFFVAQLPLNASGKVQKIVLRDWIKSGAITPTTVERAIPGNFATTV